MRLILFLSFLFAGLLQAQTYDSLSVAGHAADSVLEKRVGSDLFHLYLQRGPVRIEKSAHVVNDGKGGYKHLDLYYVWYYIYIYDITDSLHIIINPDMTYLYQTDAWVTDSLKDAKQHPVISKEKYLKALRKENAKKKFRTFEFREDGIIGFFEGRKTDAKHKHCIWSNAINLHTGYVFSGHWWCDH